MKKLAVALVLLISSNNTFFSQRNREDSLNFEKVKQVDSIVTCKLSGIVTSQDIQELTNYIWNSKSSTIPFQFFCMLNPDLFEMNSDPNQQIDANYLDQAFTQLKNKNNVRVELVSVDDYYDTYDAAHKKSDYMLVYNIHFINDTSFGDNTKNFIDLKIDVIGGKITSIFYNPNKI
jgi:hypothetical protein